MRIPVYHETMTEIPLTNPLKNYPSNLSQDVKDHHEHSYAICYLIPKINSNIQYFLEFDVQYDKDYQDFLYDYGILALYTTKNNLRYLIDLEDDAFIPPVDHFDKLLKDYHFTEQVTKKELCQFVTHYSYSNGFNAKEHFETLLSTISENDKIKELNKIQNKYSDLLR